jgi:hypothetical protein
VDGFMNRIYSLEHVPELVGLSKRDRRVILLYYFANRVPARGSSLKEDALVGSIIVAQIAGCIWGAIVWPSTFWGLLFGGIITMTFVMVVFYFGNLHFEISTFRRFLQAGHSELLLQQMGKLRTDERARAFTARHAALDFLRQCRARAAVGGSSDGTGEALKRVTFDTARSSEVMELSEELVTQSLGLFDSSKDKQQEAWRALKFLRLATFLRLIRESSTLQTEAFRCLRQSGGLLHSAEATLGTAAALLAEVKRESKNEG